MFLRDEVPTPISFLREGLPTEWVAKVVRRQMRGVSGYGVGLVGEWLPEILAVQKAQGVPTAISKVVDKPVSDTVCPSFWCVDVARLAERGQAEATQERGEPGCLNRKLWCNEMVRDVDVDFGAVERVQRDGSMGSFVPKKERTTGWQAAVISCGEIIVSRA